LDIPAADTENAPKWHSNPAFFDFVVHQVKNNGSESGNEVVMSVQDQLAACNSEGDVNAVVRGKLLVFYQVDHH
jgi:hypothetical protein